MKNAKQQETELVNNNDNKVVGTELSSRSTLHNRSADLFSFFLFKNAKKKVLMSTKGVSTDRATYAGASNTKVKRQEALISILLYLSLLLWVLPSNRRA